MQRNDFRRLGDAQGGRVEVPDCVLIDRPALWAHAGDRQRVERGGGKVGDDANRLSEAASDWRVEGHAKWRADGSSTTAAFGIPLRPFGTEEAEDILGAGVSRQSIRDPERKCEFGGPLAVLDDAFAHQRLVDRAETRQLGVRVGSVRPTPRNEEHRDDRGSRYGDRVGDFRKSEHE